MAVIIGPHTLSRAQLLPAKYKSRTLQTSAVAGDGSVATSGMAITEQLYTLRCKLPRAEARRIIDYIENTLRFRAETCQVTDGFGVTRTMRYWDGELDATYQGGATVELDLVFRKEVAA